MAGWCLSMSSAGHFMLQLMTLGAPMRYYCTEQVACSRDWGFSILNETRDRTVQVPPKLPAGR